MVLRIERSLPSISAPSPSGSSSRRALATASMVLRQPFHGSFLNTRSESKALAPSDLVSQPPQIWTCVAKLERNGILAATISLACLQVASNTMRTGSARPAGGTSAAQLSRSDAGGEDLKPGNRKRTGEEGWGEIDRRSRSGEEPARRRRPATVWQRERERERTGSVASLLARSS